MTHSDRNYGGSIPRYLAILVAAVLGLSLFPATAMAAHNPDGDDPCAGADGTGWDDVADARDVHEDSIECVWYRSLAVGANADEYNPLGDVQRDQMASFIVNTLTNAGYDLPEGDDAFTDDDGNTHEGSINALEEAGIVNGTTATTYSPNQPVQREQMASFMVQAANWAVGEDHPVEGGDDEFTDDDDSVHEGNINAGEEAGLFSGVTATTFEPNRVVLRDQMATFLVRLLQYIYNPSTAPAPTAVEAEAQGGVITGTIEGATSADVAGDCVTNGEVTDTDGDDENDEIAFEIPVNDDAEAGDCVLTFTIVRPNGQTVTREVTVEIEGEQGNNQDFTVTPSANQNVEEGTVTQFTVSGISSTTVDIALVGCENVDTNENGVVTFPNSSNPGGNNNVANLGGADADNDITVINGTANNQNQFANDVSVTNGSVSFTVSNTDPDCYVAVVFDDADDDNNLDLGTDNQPTEAFGASGDVRVIQPEAPAGSVGNEEVVEQVDLQANFFTTDDDVTYYYDANDEFQVFNQAANNGAGACQNVTMEQFEAVLSTDDTLEDSSFYRNTEAGSSLFCIDDIAPAAPTNVATRNPQGANAGKPGIEVTFTESATETVASYQVFRATATQPTVTGQQVTCPAATSGSYSQVGTVADGDGDADNDTFVYYDATAQPPAQNSNPANPQYCYYVVAVDQTGDTSNRSNTAGPASATAGDTSGAPEFTRADALIGDNTVVVTYDEVINCTTVAADGSDYAVSSTNNNVTTARTETAAACVNAVNGQDDQVEITVSGNPFANGDTVVVTAQQGTDGNTVLDPQGNAQPVGDAVQTNAAADADNDGVADANDNCPNVANPNQADADNNGVGDACQGPNATDADFNEAGTAGFGNEANDEIDITYDEAPVVTDGDQVLVDADGAGNGAATTYTCDNAGAANGAGEVTCAVAGNVLTITSSAATATTTAITLGTSRVNETVGVVDAQGNEDGGFPEVIDAG